MAPKVCLGKIHLFVSSENMKCTMLNCIGKWMLIVPIENKFDMKTMWSMVVQAESLTETHKG